MNLRKKKMLAAKTLHVGKERIVFVRPRLEEIKEAITKQEIVALHKDGAIVVKEVKGRKTVVARARKRGPGKIRKKLNTRKQTYMALTRKLRAYLAGLYVQGKISKEDVTLARKKIRNRLFRSKSHMKEQLNIQ